MKHDIVELYNVPSQRSGYEPGTFSDISGVRLRHGQENQDASALARLGKSQELKRRFGFLSLFGFSCTILATWETALALFTQAFNNGGPAGLAWGFPIAWLCSTSVYMVLAEMASIAPIAGGQYFWTAMLAPRRYGRFLSYITGWLTALAWIATLAAGIVFVGTMIQGLIILNYPDSDARPYQGTLLSWSVILVAIIVNTLAAGLLPFLEGVILIIHTLGFIGVIVALLYLSDHVAASDVFFRPLNEGGWPTQGLSYCVGFIGNVGTFVGADAAVHMSEEIDNAAVNVPRAMVTSLILNGSTGYGMVLAVLFCLTNIDTAIDSPTGYPFIEVFAEGTSVVGATIMTSFIVVLLWCAAIGFLATASRMTWSFARDKALPFHRIIRKVDARTSVPVYAILVVTVIPCLLALIYIGSPVIYEDVVSMSVSGLYASYMIPCSLLLWRRVTGKMLPYDEIEYRNQPDRRPSVAASLAAPPSRDGDEVVDLPLMWGPWKLPGVLGTLNNALACVYCVFVLFWDFWPPDFPATPRTMNYAIVVTGGVVILSIVYYVLHGNREYKGPLVDREVALDSSAPPAPA